MNVIKTTHGYCQEPIVRSQFIVFLCACIKKILEYAQIVVTHVNSCILDIEDHSIIFMNINECQIYFCPLSMIYVCAKFQNVLK